MADEELIIGLVGAVGCDLASVSDNVAKELRRADYKVETIKLSELITDLHQFSELKNSSKNDEDMRIDQLMDAGNKLRSEITGRGDAIALLAISRIRELRSEFGEDPDRPLKRYAYILDSLKHPDEIKTLRRIYGGTFVLFSAYEPKNTRTERLARKIADTKGDYDEKHHLPRASELVQRDENEPDIPLGQNVRDAFPYADVFLDVRDPSGCSDQISRAIDIIFGQPFASPTTDEYGMFQAKASSLRSTDLSRQVGAVVTAPGGEIVATGLNEVPTPGGGFIWEGKDADTDKDHRDFRVGYDPTSRMKVEMTQEVIEKLKEAGWLSEDAKNKGTSTLAKEALRGKNAILNDTRIASIIEFGRIVHAEMVAICDAARRGNSLEGMSLYCTTFPCHMCARLIIASGIKRVIYVEPYPKSLAKILYEHEISVDHDTEADEEAVDFEPFVGISPERYFECFMMKSKRKDDKGIRIKWKIDEASPVVRPNPLYTDAEKEWLIIRDKLGMLL